MTYGAITCMDLDYYNKCGDMMVDSFEKHWSNIMPLHVYTEGDDFSVSGKNIIDEGWNLGEDFCRFIESQSNKKVKTFAKKAFSIIKATETLDYDKIIWIDADSFFKQPIELSTLEEISPDNVVSTHFSVWHNKNNKAYHSCETGFFILNKKHKDFKKFIDTYKNIYTEYKTEGLRRFYDGEVYGKTVEILENNNMLNLNTGMHKTPIPRSILQPYIAHLKSSLKDRVNKDLVKKELGLL